MGAAEVAARDMFRGFVNEDWVQCEGDHDLLYDSASASIVA